MPVQKVIKMIHIHEKSKEGNFFFIRDLDSLIFVREKLIRLWSVFQTEEKKSKRKPCGQEGNYTDTKM